MLPIGPLMIEHRLIERMIKAMKQALHHAEKVKEIDPGFIETATDFIRSYADRCHHGKEEDILFRDLQKKTISDEHSRIMTELIEEHKWGRKTTARLVEANSKHKAGDERAISVITQCIKELVDFYPKHIEKEDRHFFIPIMEYFNKAEKEAMLAEGYEFDQKLIHEKYAHIVSQAEASGLHSRQNQGAK
jgi:hemerythrin-like domain-containing protein